MQLRFTDALGACGAFLIIGFFARLGWAVGGLVVRWLGMGEPHTTNHFHGCKVTQAAEARISVEAPNA